MKPKSLPLPPLVILLQRLSYDPHTGNFSRLTIKCGPGRKKDYAGYVNGTGYVSITVAGGEFLAHRLAWFMFHGTDPDVFEIDHINGDRTDNRIGNLRLAEPEGNARNARRRNDNTSGMKGVTMRPSGKWCARLRAHGQLYFYQQFEKASDAKAALDLARKRLHGDFARIE